MRHDRRTLLVGALGAAGAALLPLAPPPPPTKKAWPIDIRPPFRNIADPWRLEVMLNGERVGRVVAVSPETGHVLHYGALQKGERYPAPTVCHLPCARHAQHFEFEDDDRGVPLYIEHGRIELRRSA